MNLHTRGYVDVLNTEGDILRTRFTTDRGTVIRYMVQYEVNVAGRHYPAVHYDSAHGAPHQDLLDWEGTVVKKTWLSPAPFGEAFTDAVNTIKRLWPRMRQDFLRRKP